GSDQRWVVDGYFYGYFFTDNTEYHGREILRQEPLPGFEAHLRFNLTPDLWASLDAKYSLLGTTCVVRVNQYDAPKRPTGPTEWIWHIGPRNSVAFLFAKSVVHVNAPIFTQVAVKYFYSWGSGYR